MNITQETVGSKNYLKIKATPSECDAMLDIDMGNYREREVYVKTILEKDCKCTFLRPEDVGALTDSPIIGILSDPPFVSDEDSVYWFPDYQVHDPWAQLAMYGEVFFTKGE